MIDASHRWHAVLNRDRIADGQFVYAVASTGIYCRPSCPSRRPARRHVRFFANADDARRAGFRACLRCRPDASDADPWVQRIRDACARLAAADGHVPLATLGREAGTSPYHLQRHFKRLVSMTPRQYAEACRVRRLKQQIRSSGSVTDAMYNAGFGSSSRMYERAAPMLGMRPTTYRNGGEGMNVRFTIVGSPLGRLLVAATSRGVCAVAMGASDPSLEAMVSSEYPRAAVTRDDGALRETAALVVAHLSGQRPRLDLPLDIQATAFEWQVWTALRQIPFGETRTYAQVAASIGRPAAVRAVARACARNPVALAIPCHRVVPAAGGTGGYRWGAARKRRLLSAEQG